MEHRDDGRGQGCLHVNTFAGGTHTHKHTHHSLTLQQSAPLDPPELLLLSMLDDRRS